MWFDLNRHKKMRLKELATHRYIHWMFTQSIVIIRRVAGVVAPYSTLLLMELFTYHTILRQWSERKSRKNEKKKNIYKTLKSIRTIFNSRCDAITLLDFALCYIRWSELKKKNIYFCTWNRISLFLSILFFSSFPSSFCSTFYLVLWRKKIKSNKESPNSFSL
jgi:hypothetical protein